MTVTAHTWTLNALAPLALALAVAYTVGLQRLLRRTRPDRVRARRLRALLFYAGVLVILLAVLSPLEQRGYDYFSLRIVQHLMLMFAAPVLLIAGAPWQPLLLSIPLRIRRRVLPALLHDSWARPLRSAAKVIALPWFAIVVFNIVMLALLTPPLFDLSERSRFVHVWLANGAMIVAGVLFWSLIVPSPPLRRQARPALQLAGLLISQVVMTLVALSMTLLSRHPWFSAYAHVSHATFSQLADQQLGAGVLWVCGDMWAVPPLVLAAYSVLTSHARALDAALERGLAERPQAVAAQTAPGTD